MSISELRKQYHIDLCSEIIRIRKRTEKTDYPNFADGDSKQSREIAWGIFNRIDCENNYEEIKGQTAGKLFEVITCGFIAKSFSLLNHVRPGKWKYDCSNTSIANFDQYSHLNTIEQIFGDDTILKTAFGGNYIVRPDIVVSRMPLDDDDIGTQGIISKTTEQYASLTPLRAVNHPDDGPRPILHAVASCKWTIRNDRAQNTRTEVLNLIRHRKGNLPHIVAITAEPFPSRIAALALGTGDIDCVYHIALPELIDAVNETDNEESKEITHMMVDGRRLRDISDLPFDLAV